MTLPAPTSPPTAKAEAVSARKRRRRAPAGGASDDCFTCAKRSVKCDRKRPYCSQCLEIGNECSGYKTQLTWGVGVASRGKLRGLSLPIAKGPPVSSGIRKPSQRPRASSTASRAQWQESGLANAPDADDVRNSPVDFAGSPSSIPFHSFNGRPSHPQDLSVSMPASNWMAPNMSTSLPLDIGRFANLQQINTQGLDNLSSSVDSLGDTDYMSSSARAFSHEDVAFMASPSAMYAESYASATSSMPQSPIGGMMMEQHRVAPTSCPEMPYAPSEPRSSLHSTTGVFNAHLHNRLSDYEPLATPGLDAFHAQPDGLSWPLTVSQPTSTPQEKHELGMPWPAIGERAALPVNPDLVAKMPFFIDYYENTMCPSMVFIDGPDNPFRTHIMRLAADSASLQHAICALASCNMRMKRKLTLGARDVSSTDLSRTSHSSVETQSISEEYQHRNLAVQLLNEQLNDQEKSVHDSVLATILLLCHYRMAESGIARFQTQFAGVNKILDMRRSSIVPPSPESWWMEALFTYFDAISASINDRETQLDISAHGLPSAADLLLPGSENLVGCDRELFRSIVKLGRLNLLSQHRPVSGQRSHRSSQSRSQSPSGLPVGIGLTMRSEQHSLKASDGLRGPLQYDGNGFGSIMDDEDVFLSSMSSSPRYDDHRSTFWREWKNARIALQSWEYDPQRMVMSLPSASPVTGAQLQDLGSLSEAFRYAALLYTERLASPKVPSAHGNFRNLVSQVVYYATSLEAGSSAEKFLLWPLFVAGSECVNEMQQGVIRSKCREIMSRSGYMNNLAALEVLERLWASDLERQQDQQDFTKRGPFSWTQCIGGPGVEVEWIMF